MQLDWPAVAVGESVHDPPVTLLPPSTVTVPDGAETVPEPWESVRVIVTFTGCPATAAPGETTRADADVVRAATVIVMD